MDPGRRIRVAGVAATLAAASMLALGGCGGSVSHATTASSVAGAVRVVAGEDQYGDVASQIGGPYVEVYSVDSNPNTDPHSYEATPSVAGKIAGAKLLIDNGLGYDTFMSTMASASPSSGRRVIDVQHLLALPDADPNPHLWYDPATMPAVARAVAADLSALDPAHAAAFDTNLSRFLASLHPWLAAIAAFKAAYAGTPAATTEPVADALLTAMGIHNLTPFRFQADIMNGTDPTPQDVSFEDGLFTGHRVKLFCYNQQVTDPLTDAIRQAARRAGVAVVGVYETMPTGYDYQSWMMAEVAAIRTAVSTGKSVEQL